MNKCYSHNEEDFFSDLETAMDFAVENFFIDSSDFCGETEIQIFEADKKTFKIGDFIPKYITDSLLENAWEESGEHSESWERKLNGREKEIQETIEDALNKWADLNNCHPNFFGVKNIQPISVKIKVDESGLWDMLDQQ